MITATAFADSTAFRAGQEHMQRRVGELLRYRRQLITSLPMSRLNRVDNALMAEIDVIIRAIDAIPTGGPG